ncbi:type II toxin-antitoxin system mRNA interferase toxin, RelE/StbE family [Candidatus Hamiltonella defensa]|uniref:Type II toxin-antitoxin system mRNA interferase toxin, RelE/StbE family n=1 Tax=Candidatus Williamhamiltonella defendens TaxID=138072 RepID=A0AAC9VKU4_9ENTR|nr:type II toxin-antitoxin system YafQ family toxin [Candidatus Hamiltonella defensa]ASV33877.1 type II toxin-antitoxin system mRNA interferase toxin, RelE/StbE family [Candidatus Hamiltonella defensa]AWK16836.1 type II toxin-antitoxin system mRNA interferase toxin, RelE/StbE family [Candidatus Hamiltonella defensa]MBK4362299.1 type II toxin-antitoxin system mRNA interferase toxin, RelE/StbE family [Candidatus Hamiltonella defensa]
MRIIKQTSQFKRDLKREKTGRYRATLNIELITVLSNLAQDQQLASRYFDHPLKGKLEGFRDCHIKPDLVLIYEKPDDDTLNLIRLGSHSELAL